MMFKSLAQFCTCSAVILTAWSIAGFANAQERALRIQAAQETADAAGQAHSLEIRILDGKISAKLNGEEVPESQIKRFNGRVVILDSNGKEIEVIHLRGEGNLPQAFEGRVIAEAPQLGRLFAREQPATPKVMVGMHMGEPGPALEHHLGIESATATLVTGVYEGMPAHAAGIGEFDVITHIDGKAPANPEAMRKTLADKNPGDKLKLSVIQKGKPKEVELALVAYDRQAMEAAKFLGSTPPSVNRAAAENIMRGMRMAPEAWNDGAFRQFLIAPEAGARGGMEALIPEVEQRARERAEEAARRREDVEQHMQQLNRRMEQMERMLQRMMEQQQQRQQNRGTST